MSCYTHKPHCEHTQGVTEGHTQFWAHPECVTLETLPNTETQLIQAAQKGYYRHSHTWTTHTQVQAECAGVLTDTHRCTLQYPGVSALTHSVTHTQLHTTPHPPSGRLHPTRWWPKAHTHPISITHRRCPGVPSACQTHPKPVSLLPGLRRVLGWAEIPDGTKGSQWCVVP